MSDSEILRTLPPELADLPDAFWSEATVVEPVKKRAISLRVDEDVLAWFKASGPWRTRYSPNPFSARTAVEYTVAETNRARLAVFDVAGRMVRMLVDAPQAPGRYVESWDGRDGRGAPVPSGVYFILLQSRGQAILRKAVLAK